MLRFAGQHDVMAEDADVFKFCIQSRARRERYQGHGPAEYAAHPLVCARTLGS